MRKSLVLTAVLALSLGVAAASFAATSVNLRVLVTVSEGSGIDNLFGDDYGFPAQAVGTTAINPNGRWIFRNVGSTTDDWQMQMSNWTDIGSNPLVPGWTFLTTDPNGALPGINEVRLGALWGDAALVPVLADFTDTDMLSTALTACGADAFARAADPIGVKGYQVAPTLDRSLYLMFQAPASGSDHLGMPNNLSTLTVSII